MSVYLSPGYFFQDYPLNGEPDAPLLEERIDFLPNEEIQNGVIKVTNLKDNQRYILKISTDEKTKDFVDNEKNLLKRLNEQDPRDESCIIRLVVSLYQDKASILILPYCSFGNLRSLILANKNQGLSAKKTALLVEQILKGLSFIHKNNIIHRDIKPENIVLSNERDEIKIIDFGVAIEKGKEGKYPSAGTMPYLSPERFFKENDFGADVWGAGCVGVELFCGLTSFMGKDKIPSIHHIMFHQVRLGTYPDRLLSQLSCETQKKMEQAIRKSTLLSLESLLSKACQRKPEDAEIDYQHLKELFRKALTLDSETRPSCDELLTEEVFRASSSVNPTGS